MEKVHGCWEQISMVWAALKEAKSRNPNIYYSNIYYLFEIYIIPNSNIYYLLIYEDPIHHPDPGRGIDCSHSLQDQNLYPCKTLVFMRSIARAYQSWLGS